MKIIKRINSTDYENIPEYIANDIRKRVRERETSNKEFASLRYHEKLEEIYREVYGEPKTDNSNSEIVYWYIDN